MKGSPGHHLMPTLIASAMGIGLIHYGKASEHKFTFLNVYFKGSVA